MKTSALFICGKFAEFKDASPKEFNRIKNLPLKARTARKIKKSKKEGVDNSTVVFLKSPYKTEFYRSDDENRVIPINFVEAAEIFEAKSGELPYNLPEKHYEHVKNALQAFRQDFFTSTAKTAAAKDKTDAYSKQAQKFLRDLKTIGKNTKIKPVCDNLIELVEQGTYTSIPKDIRRIRLKMDKRKISIGEAENLIRQLAKKYGALENTEESDSTAAEINANIEPEVVLSETFID